MNAEQQKQFIALFHQYNNTPKTIIKSNLSKYLDQHAHARQLPTIANNTGVSLSVLHQIRKNGVVYVPDFIPAMLICDVLDIPITVLFKEV